jgi:3-dehydroquinate dehydratase-1
MTKRQATSWKQRFEIEFRAGGKALLIGRQPRVVGTLASFPVNLPSWNRNVACDIVEVRLDQMPEEKDWLNRCRMIQSAGLPVILTIRHQSEGGKWGGSEERRLELYREALAEIAAADVEYASAIAKQVAEAAKALGKAAIVSFHDFLQTPPLTELKTLVAKAQAFAGVVKITSMAKNQEDIHVLQQLLKDGCDVPLCVMGMGELGAQTRVSLARAGSCFVYGYLDKPMAPGQLSAAELVRQLGSVERRVSGVE